MTALIVVFLLVVMVLNFWAGLSIGYEFGRRLGWEDGFVQGHEAGHLDTLDPRPYVMEIKDDPN